MIVSSGGDGGMVIVNYGDNGIVIVSSGGDGWMVIVNYGDGGWCLIMSEWEGDEDLVGAWGRIFVNELLWTCIFVYLVGHEDGSIRSEGIFPELAEHVWCVSGSVQYNIHCLRYSDPSTSKQQRRNNWWS